MNTHTCLCIPALDNKVLAYNTFSPRRLAMSFDINLRHNVISLPPQHSAKQQGKPSQTYPRTKRIIVRNLVKKRSPRVLGDVVKFGIVVLVVFVPRVRSDNATSSGSPDEASNG